ncbi:RsmB/NOP family class I SAM-dependent RNA methyltransferase [Fuscibacter oryzae]|uniref:RsmB/NOP family class I SAM-dependent RNA methyltransferase n=1 Tax=Fuscibacter oryzae TaxID=2803939 RepID=A0A8J7MSB5_9RHOB|nr:RsmB/NOP family class I SAM-dependent RNA methyltransferase [Fuscibacter oryzae]MBL4928030.1 RsmB/NOP family class I SAM-dependent RNA methyltransferase [Fuscibacter oryzae]
MTPPARAAAAIAVLDRILAGENAEQALTNWGRASRFAGSGDRAAVRDLVFQALRCRRSYAALGGAQTGRGLILGHFRAEGIDLEAVFTGEGHAPARASGEEGRAPTENEALDCPDWLAPRLEQSLGDDFPAVMASLRQRAPVFLRVNVQRCEVAEAQAMLEREGIATRRNHLAKNALEVTENARKIQASAAYADGAVELQDAASQAIVEALPLAEGMRVLDHCAGGGGKTLAMAARARLKLWAHDVTPGRMRDLPARAARAGVKVALAEIPEKTAPYDLVLTDVPCSGSGSWRRDPQGKWALTAAKMAELAVVQATILARAAAMVGPSGWLAYATCSLLEEENDGRIATFLAANPNWRQERSLRLTPLDGADGFFLSLLTRI